MNFLAHLHIATLAKSSLIGNLAADFIRGDPYSQYSSKIADGVMLHRKVDILTDSLTEVKKAKRLFAPLHQRTALITLDVLWDHFLTLHWNKIYPEQSLADFCHWVERTIHSDVASMPADFQHLNHFLWQEQWIENYRSLDFIEEVLLRMSIRRPKLASLATSITDIREHYDALGDLFLELYPHLIQRVLQEQNVLL